MPVAATQVNGETTQAIGSLAQILYAPEASWGGASPLFTPKMLRNLGGESLDQNLAVYQSRQIRPDREHNAPVLGSMDPGGNLPFELSPEGWNWALYHMLLPNSVTTAGPSGGLTDPSAAPTSGGTAALAGGVPAGTYYYVYTAYNATGETNPSPASTGIVVASPSQVSINITTVSGATGYNIYRGTSSSGPFYFAGTGAGSPILDKNQENGIIAPAENTTGQFYTYTIRGGTTGTPLPIGFSLEKGFKDIGSYLLFTGCKIDKMRLDVRPDAIPSGTFDIIAKKFATASSSVFTNAPSPSSTIDPYTGGQVTLYEGTNALPVGSVVSGNPLGLCNDFTLNFDNAMYRRNGFIIGDNTRQNLKPGSRAVTFSGRFMFQDMTLYNKAINGTNTSLKLVFTSAVNSFWSHIIDLPTVRLTPNGSTPKITNDGPIEIQLQGRALPDPGIGCSIQITMNVPTPSLAQ